MVRAVAKLIDDCDSRYVRSRAPFMDGIELGLAIADRDPEAARALLLQIREQIGRLADTHPDLAIGRSSGDVDELAEVVAAMVDTAVAW